MWKKNIYIKGNLDPFSLNRTKIDLYFDCQKCFYLDQRFGIKRPHGTPLVINNIIIDKFKEELNIFRSEQKVHPEILKLKKNYIPCNLSLINYWKNPFKGIRYLHKKTNFLLTGAIDDIWVNQNLQSYHPVIIKSTSKKQEITIDNIWQGYWKQLSFYSYLLSNNSLEIPNSGIFFYINTVTNPKKFENTLNFNFLLFEKELDLNWIESSLKDIYQILNDDKIPIGSRKCKFCNYHLNVKSKLDEKL